MSGHVFHEGHDDLHGVTVVVRGKSGRTYVGRWHERTAAGVAMRDAAIHDPETNQVPIDTWLARQRQFGVNVATRFCEIPDDEAQDVELFDPA